MNRGVRRLRIFDEPHDYGLFLDLAREAQERTPLRILAYCLMPNHFHFMVWPANDSEMSQFMHWLTGTHSKRWHLVRGSTGTGHVYQDRFKAAPVQDGKHFLTVCRYVERNAKRAGLATRAEEWPWGSLYQRQHSRTTLHLAQWPVDRPDDWLNFVNETDDPDELARLRDQLRRGLPIGDEAWRESMAERMGIALIPSKGGRPKKKPIPGIGFQPDLPD